MSINRKMRRQMLKGAINYNRQQAVAEECVVHGRQLGRKEAMDTTFEHIMTMVFLALHDKFGFGPIRFDRLISAMKVYALAMYSREITLEEMKECVKKECGVDIEELKRQEVAEDYGVIKHDE